ncbi:MAG: hypothetical protein POELPBGB_03283 [Bacteroidia bacterium]|nr:hypothetical protein [Bacteroidia bacterium]
MKPAKEIPRISPVDKISFYSKFVSKNKPVIIEGLADDWPAMKKWNMNFFAENYSKVEPVTIAVKDGKCDVTIEKGVQVSFTAIEKTINKIIEGNVQNGYAIATTDDVFPADLKNDYPVPAYCADGSYLRTRIFIGAEGTTTWLHQDLFENLYTMVKGKKRIILFDPWDTVYPQSRFSKLPNHARPDAENIDYEKFPRMKNAQPYIVDLKAGETLYLPSLWWHHLKNIEESIAVSFWWAYGWKLPVVWAAAQYKKIRQI